MLAWHICREPGSSAPRPRLRARAIAPMRLAWVLSCCLPLLGLACQVTSPKNLGDSRVHAEKDYSANAEQMRLRMRAQVQPMCGVIVASANHILAATTDYAVRRQALLWKIEAVPALREALFQPNPKTALLDTWVLTFQMTDYFQTGPGAQGLGEAHAIAVTASQQLEAEMAGLANSLTFSGDMSKVRQFARNWAAQHPMSQSIAGRESTLSLVTEKELADVFSTSEAMGSLVVSVDDLNRRLEIYSAQLLEQARWQAELFAMDQAQLYQLGKVIPLAENAAKSAARVLDALDGVGPTIARSLAVLEKTPAMLTEERKAAVKAMVEEMARTTSFVREERMATVQQFTAERIATVKDVGEVAAQQRQFLTRDAERITLASVDHAFLRAAQVCAGALLCAFFAAALLMLLARRLFAPPRHPPKLRPPEP